MLSVTLYPQSLNEEDRLELHDFDFISLVNEQTYGPPPLVAPKSAGDKPLAQIGDRVLYINTNLVAAFEITRDSD